MVSSSIAWLAGIRTKFGFEKLSDVHLRPSRGKDRRRDVIEMRGGNRFIAEGYGETQIIGDDSVDAGNIETTFLDGRIRW